MGQHSSDSNSWEADGKATQAPGCRAQCSGNSSPSATHTLGRQGTVAVRLLKRSGTVGTQAYGSNLGPEIVAHWATQAPGGGMQ